MTQVADKRMTTSTWFRELPSGGDSWLDALRKAGAERFEAVGFPHSKDEEWRFTQLGPLTKTKFVAAHADERMPAVREAVEQFTFGNDAAAELVFVNGRYAPQLSRPGKLPRGVRVLSLAEAADSDEPALRQHLAKHARIDSNPFVALNTGFVRDGAFIHLTRGATLEQPIHLLFLSTAGRDPTVSHPRILAVLDEGAQATLVESYAGASSGTYFTNPVTRCISRATPTSCRIRQRSVDASPATT
jgi:Fe-S cluster assembly protein SufD